MGDIVNLRRARKQAARQAAEQKAAANRALHGRSKPSASSTAHVKPRAAAISTAT
jgi:hypothetical protein